MTRERILFVTGRLAEYSLRSVVDELSRRLGFDYEVQVLGITVAALLQSDWIARKLTVAGSYDRVIIPGWVQGDLSPLSERFGVRFERGPKDLFDLPEYFGQQRRPPPDLSGHGIEILAEINHAPRMNETQILRVAESYRADGADLIDVGCIPGESWSEVGRVVARLRAEGFRVSIDSFDRQEVEPAVEAGAELVLSCNHLNREWASRLPAELVIIPDEPSRPDTTAETIAVVEAAGGRYRLDPILEPIGFDFGRSLVRYHAARQQFPGAALMMGIGNLTELTEVDSSGVNFLLAALCEEWNIGSVLTTQVINWARTSVREFDLARRLVRHSISKRVLPKHLTHSLVMLRDPRAPELGEEGLRNLAGQVRDPNFRIFAERGELHLFNRDGYWRGEDPYQLLDDMLTAVGPLTAEHAFYLGYELCKARTALTLGKHYVQDEALKWGFLTVPEISATERRKTAHAARPLGTAAEEPS